MFNSNFIVIFCSFTRYSICSITIYESSKMRCLEYVQFPRSLKVICNDAFGFPVYGFILVLSNNCPLAICFFTRHEASKLRDPEFYLSRLLEVKYNGAVGHHIYDFLLVLQSIHIYPSSFSCWNRLNICSYQWAKVTDHHLQPLSRGDFFSKSNHLFHGSWGKAPTKWNWLA